MPKQSELTPFPGNGQHGCDAAIQAARKALKKCRSLTARQRVPTSESWASRIGKGFRDGVLAAVMEQRRCSADDLRPTDYALLDSTFFVVCGLAQGYGFLGAKGWIDERQGGFRPVVEMCLKLQRMLLDNLDRLGIANPPRELDVLDALYGPAGGAAPLMRCDDPADSTDESNFEHDTK